MKTEGKKKKSYFNRVFLSMIIMTIIITLTLTVFLTANYLNTSIAVTAGFNQNLLSQTNFAVDQMNDNALRLSMALYNDKDIISFLYMRKMDNMVPIVASRTLDKQLVTLPYVDSVYLYNASLDLFFSSKSGEQLQSSEFKDNRIAQAVTDPAFVENYDGIPLPGAAVGTTHITQTISYIFLDTTATDQPLKNAVIINIDPAVLTDSIRSMNTFRNGLKMDFVVMDSLGNVLSSVLSPKLERNAEIYPLLYNMPARESIWNNFVRINGTGYFRTDTRDNDNEWNLISLVPSRLIFNDIIGASLAGAVIMILVFLFCCLISSCLAKKLNSPIRTIAHMMKGEKVEQVSSALTGTQEFQMILSSFENMQERSKQLDRMKRESAYSVSQDCLNHVLTESSTDSVELTRQKLKDLGLGFIVDHTLCMCVFKIDCYEQFLSENSSKELWVLRFAMVNIMGEIASRHFASHVFSRDNDKFVVLLDCQETVPYKVCQEKTQEMVKDIQLHIKNHMKLSLTGAYSTLFQGLEHLPSMYHNMENLLLLKMKYGHGCVISPHMADDLTTDVFPFPAQKAGQIALLIHEGKEEQAVLMCRQICGQLFQYDYSEILSGSIHLVYSLYTDVLLKYPELKEDFTPILKDSLAGIQNAEIAGDVEELICFFLKVTCDKTSEYRNENTKQSSEVITEKICRIIDEKYGDPALCLSYIAEAMGLSPNYIGRIFKSSFQKSVAQYVSDYRMEKLAEYLNGSGLTLTAILEKVGIEKNNYFYTQFKKHFGVSLGEYRMQLEDTDKK